MTTSLNSRTISRSVSGQVRQKIERAGEHLWRLEDFRGLPFTAVAQAFSRLTRAGVIQRLSKGIYYHGRKTAFGSSKPNPAALQELVSRRRAVFPSGSAAANLLGFTTQNAKEGEIATNATSLPRKLIGKNTVVHTRRPEAWADLSAADAALFDFLRRAGKASELSPEETLRRTAALLSEKGRFERLVKAAATEPPRVRAILGALGEQLEKSPKALRLLRDSLNDFSRFDFGMLASLPNARAWQAKEPR